MGFAVANLNKTATFSILSLGKASLWKFPFITPLIAKVVYTETILIFD